MLTRSALVTASIAVDRLKASAAQRIKKVNHEKAR
jgi:hypothetical protein